MAFTQMLAVLLPLAISAQNIPPTYPFGGPTGFPSSLGPSSLLGHQFGNSLAGLTSFPGSTPQTKHRPKLTVRCKNGAGDKLRLTIEEESDLTEHVGPPAVGGLFSHLRGSYFQNGPVGRSRDLRVHGIFIKAGAKTGVTSQASLRGTFAMVVMSNGNTAGACVGTGVPFVPNRRPRFPGPLGPGPFSPGRSGPFNPLGGRLFGDRNPFFPQFYSAPQEQPTVVTTPLQANGFTGTIEGKLRKIRINDIAGRSIHVCADVKCAVKTDMCGTIARDVNSIEEFAQVRYHQQLLDAAAGRNPLDFGDGDVEYKLPGELPGNGGGPVDIFGNGGNNPLF